MDVLDFSYVVSFRKQSATQVLGFTFYLLLIGFVAYILAISFTR